MAAVYDAVLLELCHWLNMLPARCIPMILTDANAKVGYVEQKEDSDKVMSETVGPICQDKYDANGTKFANVCKAHDVALANPYSTAGDSYCPTSSLKNSTEA